jgi:predicted porin
LKSSKIFMAVAIAVSSITFSHANTFNQELRIGIADLNDTEDNFFGVGYQYYFKDVELDHNAWEISPYLQRVDSINLDYIKIDEVSRLQVSGEVFFQNNWVVRPRFSRIADDDESNTRIGTDIGQFIQDNWEVGAGLDYFKSDTRFDYDENDDFLFSVYTRYTTLERNSNTFKPGWDLELQGTIIGEDTSVVATAAYYFSPKFSLYGGVTQVDRERRDATTAVNLGTNYWFNRSFSINFGLGVDVGGDGLRSIDLLASYRF